MEIIIHRGINQIGGIATEVRTEKTRIIIDLGTELGLGVDFIPKELSIPGVTDKNGSLDAVLFTHQHGDHIGQLYQLRDDVPIYMGAMTKELELVNPYKYQKHPEVKTRIYNANIFEAPIKFTIGDIVITPIAVDHSASDSYMFLLEADGKKVLYTGDFRLHGFKGKGVTKALHTYVKKVDVIVTEGTTFSREEYKQITELDIKRKTEEYMKKYKYVFVLCSSMNMDRIAGAAAAVPKGKYFLCDNYQKDVIEILRKYQGMKASLYDVPKVVTYGDNILERILDRGCLMLVRANQYFYNIISKFPKENSIILFELWKGYLDVENSPYKNFLKEWNSEYLHTSGHACLKDVQKIIDIVNPEIIIPIHTEKPEALASIYKEKVVRLKNGEVRVL